MKKENGYALVTVLLIISIFMVLFLSFMGQSLNTVKQTQIVEKKSKSVALAEMGISYYQTAVQNIYDANKQNVNNQVKEQIDADRQNNQLQSYDSYVMQGVNLMKTTISSGLNTLQNSVPIDGNPNDSFTLTNKNFYTKTTNKKIQLTVIGNDNGKITTLSTELSFEPTISGLNSTGSGTTNTYTLPTFNSIPQPTNISTTCNNPVSIVSIKDSCSQILIDTAKTFNENINGISNNTIFSSATTGTLFIDGNANNMNKMKIHTEKDFRLGKNANNASALTLESKGSATFDSQYRVDTGSNIYVQGNFTVNGHFELAGNSIAYIGGNTYIGGKLTVNSGSTLCVVGSLTVEKKQTITGELIEKSKVSDDVFKQKCGISSIPPVTITWGDKLVNNVNYNY
ncbi:hypothetical protein BIV60_01390 [Bacillus sp. MUM 116]|uniref:hypothetical protein n=1 Tax=Bacillus sp. MUM 116 TaxID=1678002 RepID=UPI0008F56C69|nr:hypothetical protein [Bacillus sp. MUM 116]OIK16958.1 hypothetical protein BIV60_01390 [Bacillus sp. MUM 116]